MNDRSMALLLIVVALVCYGVYAASYVPGMLIGQPVPLLLLIGFVLQAVFALAAAVAVWRRWTWAAGAVVLLGVAIAATSLIEAFVLGLIPYLHALFVSLVAIVVALVLAAYIGRKR